MQENQNATGHREVKNENPTGDLEESERKVEFWETISGYISAIGVPLFFLTLLFEALYIPTVAEGLLSKGITVQLVTVLIVWLSTFIVATTLYVFTILVPLRRARREFGIAKRLELPSNQGDYLAYLTEEVQRLADTTARTFHENTKRYQKARTWRREAATIIESVRDGRGTDADLTDAADLLSSVDELIIQEKRDRYLQKIIYSVAVFIMALYIVGLIYIVAKYPNATALPLFGIPLAVIVWSAAGSLAAVLLKFYTAKGHADFSTEIRWLIARPVLGIIMGALSYLIIASGVSAFGAGDVTTPLAATNDALKPKEALFWAIAFLSGFSDKVYTGVISALVRTVLPDDKENNSASSAKTINP